MTICAHHGQMLFGTVVNGEMVLSPLGQIADACLAEFAERHPEIRIESYVIMPNHVHVLIWILNDSGELRGGAPVKVRKFGDAIAGSLSTLIGAYKGAVTQKARKQEAMPEGVLWQRNFWDTIVRAEQDLPRIRDYIHSNPARWQEDQLHPTAPPNEFNRTWREDGQS